MVEAGFLQKLDMSRIPNHQVINAAFREPWWDPNDEYIVPKDWGTTGILYRGSSRSRCTSWKDFYDLAKGKYSGKVVLVDSPRRRVRLARSRCSASRSTPSRTASSSRRARILLDARARTCYGARLGHLPRTTAQRDGRRCALGWTGPLPMQRAKPTPRTRATRSRRGHAVLGRHLGDARPSAAPERRVRLAQLDPGAGHPGRGDEYNGYASRNDDAKKFVDPEFLNNPAIFPPDEALANLEGADGHSEQQAAHDIWDEFKSQIGGVDAPTDERRQPRRADGAVRPPASQASRPASRRPQPPAHDALLLPAGAWYLVLLVLPLRDRRRLLASAPGRRTAATRRRSRSTTTPPSSNGRSPFITSL